MERALDLDRRVVGAEIRRPCKTIDRLGSVNFKASTRGRSAIQPGCGIQRRVLGPEHPDTLASTNGLASVYYPRGKYAQAEALHEPDLGDPAPRAGARAFQHARFHEQSGRHYLEGGQVRAGRTALNQILEIERRVLGPEHPATLQSMNNLASLYGRGASTRRPKRFSSQALQIQRRVLGPEHRHARSMGNLANAYYFQGKYAQAEALFSQTMEIQRRVLGPEHPEGVATMSALAAEYGNEGNNAQAEQLLSQVLEIERRVLGPEHSDTLITMTNVAYANAMRETMPGPSSSAIRLSRPLAARWVPSIQKHWESCRSWWLSIKCRAITLWRRRPLPGFSPDADTPWGTKIPIR